MARLSRRTRTSEEPLLLSGCGILRREIAWLVERNQWNVECRFCAPCLCTNRSALAASLSGRPDPQRPTVVFFGECHPAMDSLLPARAAVRTGGLNCFQMLLGPARYAEEIQAGAYFLLQDLVEARETVLDQMLGPHRSAARELFRSCHEYALAVRTPCSDDFTGPAEAAAELVGLPLRWTDAALDHLETVMQSAIRSASGEAA